MKNKTIILITVITSFFILLIGYKVIKNYEVEKKLHVELKELTKLTNQVDIINNKYKIEKKLTNYICNNKYLIVEKAYKKYLLDIFNESIIVNEVLNDEKLKNVLTIENINKDKEFIETISYLEETKIKFNTAIESLISLFSITKMMSYIENENLDKYYINLYEKICYDENTEEKFNKTKESLNLTLETYNNIFNVYDEAINFLIINESSYEIKDGLLYFENDELSNEYNSIVSKLK